MPILSILSKLMSDTKTFPELSIANPNGTPIGVAVAGPLTGWATLPLPANVVMVPFVTLLMR